MQLKGSGSSRGLDLIQDQATHARRLKMLVASPAWTATATVPSRSPSPPAIPASRSSTRASASRPPASPTPPSRMACSSSACPPLRLAHAAGQGSAAPYAREQPGRHRGGEVRPGGVTARPDHLGYGRGNCLIRTPPRSITTNTPSVIRANSMAAITASTRSTSSAAGSLVGRSPAAAADASQTPRCRKPYPA